MSMTETNIACEIDQNLENGAGEFMSSGNSEADHAEPLHKVRYVALRRNNPQYNQDKLLLMSDTSIKDYENIN